MVKAVLFDFRDTLLDVKTSYKKSNLYLWEESKNLGWTNSFTKFQEKLHLAIQKVISEKTKDPDVHNWNILFIQKLFENEKMSKTKVEKIARNFDDEFAKYAKLYPDSKAVLKKLQKNNIKMGVIIDGTSKRENAIIKNLNLQPFLDVVIISEEIGKNKFTNLPLKTALEKIKISPSEIIVVGDRVDKDIIHANNAGCISIKLERKTGRYTNTKALSKAELPNFTITNLRELLNYVR